ncbi:DUF3558 family protein [Amycolatopsis sp. NBC_00345]|uniref:DUF3558 family protein n=1 Tax=Amycolatopsis sp. NBC_00345 TaxID=2975955 RepID=UPI002E267849
MDPNHFKVLAAAALASTVLTACTANVGGTAQASSASATSPSDVSNPLKNLPPCTTLDQVVTGRGFAPAVPTIADAQHSCRVTKKTQGDVEGVDISLSLRDGQSYKANIQNPSQASAGTVGSRAAVEEAEPLGSTGQCEVSIEVKPKSRATVGVTFSSDTDKACKLVESLADKLEPLLPKNT